MRIKELVTDTESANESFQLELFITPVAASTITTPIPTTSTRAGSPMLSPIHAFHFFFCFSSNFFQHSHVILSSGLLNRL